MKLIFYKPFCEYDVRYKYSEPRELYELQAIILSIINYSQEKNKIMIDLLLSKMNLEPKWRHFIENIFSSMIGKELNFNKDIKFNELLLGDIVINNSVRKNLDNDKFIGLDVNEKVIQKYFLLDIKTKELFHETNEKTERLNLSDKILDLCKQKNNNVSDLLDKWFEQNYSHYMCKSIEILNDETTSNQNIVFIPQIFDSEIDIENRTIKINNKDFYDLFEFANQYDILEQMFYNLQISIDKIIKNNNLEFENLILDISEYVNINDEINNYKSVFISNKDFIIYKGSITEIGVKSHDFVLNNNCYNLSFPVITYHILSENETQKLLTYTNKENNGFKKILDKLTNIEQKNIFISNILNNYKDYYTNNEYKKIIIENVNDISYIDINWLFSKLVSDEEFKQIWNKLKAPIKLLTDSKKIELDGSEAKINYLYEKHSIGYKQYNINHLDIEMFKKADKLANEILKIDNLIKFREKQKEMNEIPKDNIMLKEVKNDIDNLNKNISLYEEKLIIKEKDELILNIYYYIDSKIKGYIDKFLKQICDDSTLKWNAEKIKSIKDKKKLDENDIDLLEWANKERNDWSHATRESIMEKFSKSNLDELNQYYDKWKEVTKIFERIKYES